MVAIGTLRYCMCIMYCCILSNRNHPENILVLVKPLLSCSVVIVFIRYSGRRVGRSTLRIVKCSSSSSLCVLTHYEPSEKGLEDVYQLKLKGCCQSDETRCRRSGFGRNLDSNKSSTMGISSSSQAAILHRGLSKADEKSPSRRSIEWNLV